ncbi:MAG TPA: Hpt domain-containing protein [Segetibacter sp.]|jgi:HPt (histidine-containing phosphotransfer) domain-containing protein
MENTVQPVNGKLYDFEQLEEIADGNMDFLISLAQIFLDTIPDNSAEMVKAARSQDWAQVSKLAHKLKSTIDSLNMTSISKEIRAIEIDAKNKVNTHLLPAVCEEVDAVIQEAAVQIKQEFNL